MDTTCFLPAMSYIVDGNNVMGQTPGWHRDKPGARRGLLQNTARFARIKRARVTVVFDGAPDRDRPDGSAFQGVKVLYADRGSDADSRILRIVESSPDPRGITVVTSDRHLAFLVRSAGASVIRSGEFRRLMQDASAARSDEAEQPTVDEDLHSWMRYFGATPDDDGETEV
ncbi:MAG TPA: NYN domain-containing protein [Blastocatellia bacterium]|nr:NYN domain-containing protein [Blastocatellia bacterium]